MKKLILLIIFAFSFSLFSNANLDWPIKKRNHHHSFRIWKNSLKYKKRQRQNRKFQHFLQSRERYKGTKSQAFAPRQKHRYFPEKRGTINGVKLF